MAVRRLQNKIAESRWALPLTAVYGVAVVVALGAVERQMWAQTLLLALSTLLMVELNNANALIRIYSRMVSCSYLVLSLMATFLFPSVSGGVVSMAFIAFYVFFFQSYQDKQAVGPIFASFLALGIASIPFVQILYFVPLLWLLMAIRLQSFSVRTLCASLLGIIAPYWFVAAYFIYLADYETPLRHFSELARFSTFSLTDYPLTLNELVTLGFVVVLMMTGIIHGLRQRSKDKLRTQMIYELMMIVALFATVVLALQPQHCGFLLRILIIHAAVFIGNFMSLTQTRATNIAFLLIIVATLAITAFNFISGSQPLF